MTNLTIALDAMSGDLGPRQVVPAAIQALELYPHIHFYLVGDLALIRSLLPKKFLAHDRLQLVHASSIITHDMPIAQAIKHSQNSSMRVALELVKSHKANACVSSGNTGALMGLSKMLLHAIDGIERPALVTILPALQKKQTVLLDLGANSECTSSMLQQFAYMGSILAKAMFNIDRPKVALLNIGKEEVKGLDNIKMAASLLREDKSMNYVGYLEGNDLLTGKTDVLVCDGFVGNVTLKTLEGLTEIFFSQTYGSQKKSNLLTRFLSFLLKKKLSKHFGDLDPNRYNGACLLGLQSVVIKSHGAANSKSFLSAIQQAVVAIEQNVPILIAKSLPMTLSKSENN